MKALHLTKHFFPEYSGTTTRLYNLSTRLPFNVQILTSDRTIRGEIIIQKEEQFGNIKVNRIPLIPGSVTQSIPVLRYAHTLYRRSTVLTEFALKEQFDIVHAHNSLTFGEVAKQVSRKLNKPFILELHGLSEESSAGVLGPVKASYIERVDRNLLSYCDHAITLTQSLKEWIANYHNIPQSKITVIPNGADLDRFSPKNEHRLKAEKLKETLGTSGKVVMYAGIMDRINGIAGLAEVIPHIIRQRPELYFVFLGHGPEENKLAALSKEHPRNVKLLSTVPYEEMPTYYQMCDVFVIPRPSTTSAETLTPLKLFEAMAMEKPVLGSNVGGIAEIIKHGQNGYLFQKGNLDSFKGTLIEILDTDNTQVGKNARKTVAGNYTWDKSAKILQKVYEGLA